MDFSAAAGRSSLPGQLLGMQWEVSGSDCLLSLCRILSWENSMAPMPSFPHYIIKMEESPFLAACSSIDTDQPVLSQCNRAAIIIITTEMARSSDSVFTFWRCVRPHSPRTFSRLVAGWACCACAPGGATSAAPGVTTDKIANQNSFERQVMLKWKSWTHLVDKPLGSFTVSFSHFNQNKELKKVSLYFPLVWSFEFFKTSQCFIGLAWIM